MFQICPQNAVLMYSPLTEFYDQRLKKMQKVAKYSTLSFRKVYLNSTSEMELVLMVEKKEKHFVLP